MGLLPSAEPHATPDTASIFYQRWPACVSHCQKALSMDLRTLVLMIRFIMHLVFYIANGTDERSYSGTFSFFIRLGWFITNVSHGWFLTTSCRRSGGFWSLSARQVLISPRQGLLARPSTSLLAAYFMGWYKSKYLETQVALVHGSLGAHWSQGSHCISGRIWKFRSE